jgi:type VI secretion system protein VasG
LIDALIDQHLQPQIVDRLLAAMAGGQQLGQVHASVDAQGAVACEFA